MKGENEEEKSHKPISEPTALDNEFHILLPTTTKGVFPNILTFSLLFLSIRAMCLVFLGFQIFGGLF